MVQGFVHAQNEHVLIFFSGLNEANERTNTPNLSVNDLHS